MLCRTAVFTFFLEGARRLGSICKRDGREAEKEPHKPQLFMGATGGLYIRTLENRHLT